MNWKNEAIERLSQYNAMLQSLENIPEEIRRLKADYAALPGCRPDKIRAGSIPGPNEDRLIANFIRQEELLRSYKNAKAWMQTTDKALAVLSEEEQLILQKMYISPSRGIVGVLCEELGIEQSTIYRKRDHALYRFTMALYGAA